MGDIFLKTLNMSIAASWLILAVVLLRFVLKKAPKSIAVLLWGIVALRLVVPFSFESALSLIPSAETFNAHNIQYETPAISSGIPAINNAVNPVLGGTFAPNPAGSVNPFYAWTYIVSVIWFIGIAAMLLYAVISYVRVRRSVAERAPYEGNIFLCDHVKSPFILGLIRPKIYLPSNMDTMAMEPVIAHEKAHLARCDHWWKPLGFLILAVHWFNPLCWIAYVLLCRDIELACDEKVIRQMDLEGKKQYSTALLECNAQRRLVTICPLAFGEVGVKERVKNVLNYKKPAFWLIVAAVIACAVVTVCFATNPASAENYIRLQSTHSTPPAAFFSLDLVEEAQGTVVAERWENGRCVSTAPVSMNNLTQQIQLYLDPQENGVNVQLGIDNGDTVLETFSYPKDEKPVGWSFVSLDEGEKTALQFGKDRIIAAMVFDFGTGVKSYSCDTLSTDKEQVENAAYMIVIRTSLANNSDSTETEPNTPNAERPTLIIDGIAYVNPYMPVSMLPYGYQSAGKLTEEQSNNTGLEGIEYFIYPSKAEDFYTYQECGTPISIDTVDSTKRQWAYVRWIQDGNNAVDGRKLTLDDVVMLSQKGDALSWSDFERYQGREVGSGLYIMRYEIDELFDVLVGGVPDETPMYIELRVHNEAENHIDIRTGDVSAFIEAHRNDAPKVDELSAALNKLEYQPFTCDGLPEYKLYDIDGTVYSINFSEKWVWRGNSEQAELSDELIRLLRESGVLVAGEDTPTPAGPDTATTTLSEEQSAIRQAILEHNKSSNSQEYDVACCSFITLETLSGTPLVGSNTHKITYYEWVLYNEYKVTDNGLKTVSGGHIPVALSFDLDERGYTLTEYWEPRDGSYYAQDIREKFPAHIAEDALNNQKFILQQTQECYAQAIASTGLDTDKVIGSLIETICSSPALSSNPGDYIEEHSIEYRELTYYGRYTMKYCFAEFLKGGQTDLRGHIMRAAIDDIAPEAQLKLYAETGQEYFDAWKDAAMSVKEQHGMEWIEAHQPAIYLLLSMLGEA